MTKLNLSEEEIRSCIVTPEETLAELEELEEKIAKQLNISSPNIREELIRMSVAGELDETELVRDWLSAYSSYLDDIDEV